jgi:hypothetical protein
MRKRQLIKFAKDAKNNMKVYRNAHTGGSKKLRRRWKTMCRYYEGGGANADHHRRTHMKLKELEKRIASEEFKKNPEGAYAEMAEIAAFAFGELGE